MDLLGNPAGFARSVGTGLSNFVRLPYHGLLQGPWTFLIGISHGSASLAKHIASGEYNFCFINDIEVDPGGIQIDLDSTLSFYTARY